MQNRMNISQSKKKEQQFPSNQMICSTCARCTRFFSYSSTHKPVRQLLIIIVGVPICMYTAISRYMHEHIDILNDHLFFNKNLFIHCRQLLQRNIFKTYKTYLEKEIHQADDIISHFYLLMYICSIYKM